MTADNELVLNDYVENVFCATGPGGGVDPTCPVGGGKKNRRQPLPPNPLPRVDTETEMKMEEALKKAAAPDTIKEFISYSQSEENVPIALLSSPQTVMDVPSVEYFTKNPGEIESASPLPLVIQYGGKMIIRDGNSRTVAASKIGRDTIRARVVYVPE